MNDQLLGPRSSFSVSTYLYFEHHKFCTASQEDELVEHSNQAALKSNVAMNRAQRTQQKLDGTQRQLGEQISRTPQPGEQTENHFAVNWASMACRPDFTLVLHTA